VLRRHLPYLDEGRPIDPDGSLTELGLDSMGTMELLEDLEGHFDIVFPEEALTIATFATPCSVWRAVEALLPDDRAPHLLAHDAHAAG
jgi:acyl carrier protein